jgi:hypothetical protein
MSTSSWLLSCSIRCQQSGYHGYAWQTVVADESKAPLPLFCLSILTGNPAFELMEEFAA